MLHSVGGLAKFRRLQDLPAMLEENLNAFDAAILAHKNRSPVEVPQCKFLTVNFPRLNI